MSMSHPMCKLLGKHLCKITGEQKLLTNELPHGVTLALFFTAGKADKETLEETEKQSEEELISTRLLEVHREINKQGTAFEVIQIPLNSNDQISETSKTSQQHESPFLAIRGEHSKTLQEYLIRKYGVQSPNQVILMDGTSGHVINFQGKEKVLEDPKGAQFPWRYPKCSEILGDGHLIACTNANGIPSSGKETFQVRKGCVKGLYFGAFWCPPCRSFLSLLIDVYNRINATKKKLEIIFVSSDRSKESFDRFFSSMPWLAIPYEDEKRRKDLTDIYNIKGIPSVIIIDPQDNVITLDGRCEINEDIEAVDLTILRLILETMTPKSGLMIVSDFQDFPWYSKAVEELRDKHSTILNNSLCFVYFLGQDESEYDKAEGLLTPIAISITESDVEEALQPKFFIAADSELSESLRIFIDLEECSSQLVIMDIPNSRYAVTKNSEIPDENCIREFLHKFQTSHNQLQYRYIQSRFI